MTATFPSNVTSIAGLVESKYQADIDINWISLQAVGFDVSIINESHNYSLIAVQGPKACELLNELDKELTRRKINTKIVFICYIYN